jgi:hypothetical protein
MNDIKTGTDHRGQTYRSRLLVGSGKYRDLQQTARGDRCRRRGNHHRGDPPREHRPGPEGAQPAGRAAAVAYTILPNTAGCYTAKDAVYTLQMARELLNGHKLVKLEVLGDEKTLFPHMPETLVAAEALVQGRLRRDGLLQRRSDPGAHAGRHRLRRRDAAGVADRLRHGHPESMEPVADHRAGQGAGAGGCRRRHRLGRGHRHGTGLRRRADEQRHRRRAIRCAWRAR